MELNETGKFAVETSRMIRTYFDHKVDSSGIYDVVEEDNHRAFKIDFRAYDYFTIEFDYENDLCEFFIVLTKEVKLSLTKEPAVYSQITDWDEYLKGIKDELELRIPDSGQVFESQRMVIREKEDSNGR